VFDLRIPAGRLARADDDCSIAVANEILSLIGVISAMTLRRSVAPRDDATFYPPFRVHLRDGPGRGPGATPVWESAGRNSSRFQFTPVASTRGEGAHPAPEHEGTRAAQIRSRVAQHTCVGAGGGEEEEEEKSHNSNRVRGGPCGVTRLWRSIRPSFFRFCENPGRLGAEYFRRPLYRSSLTGESWGELLPSA